MIDESPVYDWNKRRRNPPPVEMTTTVDLSQFVRRILEDCLTEATTSYWEKRAATFKAARRRPDDFTGRATAAELAEQDARLVAASEACLAKARMVSGFDESVLIDELDRVLSEWGM